MALMLAAALLGVFGDGPVSRTRAGSGQTISVEYDRLLRASAPALYRFHVRPSLAGDGALHLRIDRALLDRMEFESITPQPEHQITGPGYGEFIFRLAPGDRAATIDIRFRPATFGRQQGRVSIDAQTVVISQYVYP